MPQTQLGRYQIVATLGRGAMGVVYHAYDPLIERTVAIKTVACAGLPDKEAEEFEQRFFREAKSAGRLNHPNIVTIHDVGRSEGVAYIAMEFLHGRSLRDILDAGAALSCARIVDIVAAVADGLAFAHAQGIVHRDIKPANIMILDTGTVKITDFGIALLPGGSLTMAGAVLGSPKYMSPEQVAGQKADGRADIFSLGAVLYEMLTGQAPFSGDNMHATMYQVLHATPAPPSGLSRQLPPGFDAIVARALAKDPAERYQNASELAADLRQTLCATVPTLSGEAPGDTASPASPAPALAWPRRIAIFAGLAALAAGAFWLLRPATPPASPQATAASAPDKTATVTAKKPAEPSADEAPRPRPVPPAARPADERPRPLRPLRDATAPTTANWQAALQADLRACDELSFFRRTACVERARWKHCPGHWGTIDDCPANTRDEKRQP